jgi:oligoendopeptidase F
MEILNEFTSPVMDYSGLEQYRTWSWQKQLHLFEVPFYYIEYGIAQLGALGLWMQYKKNKNKALQHYIYALSLGGTKTLPQLYQAAELPFNFSGDYIENLMWFLRYELENILSRN